MVTFASPPTNTAPVASDGEANPTEDQLFTGVLPPATDADGDSISYALVNPPIHGSAQIIPNGTYTYQPITNFNGADNFTYRISDDKGGSNTYTIRMTIGPVNDAPTVIGEPFTFGLSNGIVMLAIDANDNRAKGIAVQGDGKILVTGTSFVAFAGSVISLMRFNIDGSLDTEFGGGDGIITTLEAGGGSDIVLQPDGKILVAGCRALCGSTDVRFALARYSANGSLDTTFGGGDGIADVALGVKSTGFVQGDSTSLVLQGDGKILLSGYTNGGSDYDFAIVRFNTDGSLDGGFGGGDGVATTALGLGRIDIAYDIALQRDGKILVAGESLSGSTSQCAIARYTADGSLDSGFGGGDGIAIVANGSSFRTNCSAIAVATDGKILSAGFATDGFSLSFEGRDFSVIRFNSDGSLDTGFVGAPKACPISNPTCRQPGIVLTSTASGTDDAALGLRVMEDGKVLLVGGSFGSDPATTLVRHNSDGTLDASFGGGDGIVTTNVSPSSDWAVATAVQSDGKILAAVEVAGPEVALVRYNADGTLDQSFGTKKNLVREQEPFSFTLPTGRFVDPDGDLLTVIATLSDGSALPGWLSFDPATLTFSGIAPAGSPDLRLKVQATDPSGLATADEFSMLTE